MQNINRHVKKKENESLVASEIVKLSSELYWWIDFFNIAFFRDTPIPIPTLTFERARVNNSGSYRSRFNGLVVKAQINLNRLYIDRPINETLQTLIHELVHSYEFIYVPEDQRTKSWYHTKAFRTKLAAIGIHADKKGCHRAIGDPFVFLVKKHAVKIEYAKRDIKGRILIPSRPKNKGKSKLNKWSCGCQNARIGKGQF